jgi:hypothetical protein
VRVHGCCPLRHGRVAMQREALVFSMCTAQPFAISLTVGVVSRIPGIKTYITLHEK